MEEPCVQIKFEGSCLFSCGFDSLGGSRGIVFVA